MAIPTVTGVHLLPSTGEFAYDTISAVGFQRGSSGLNNATILNFFSSSAGAPTDYTNAIAQFQVDHPECKTISLVIAWFFNSVDASTCKVYPSTNFILGEFEQWNGSTFTPVNWNVSGLTEQDYPGLIPLPALPGSTNFVYGGTPSDPSVVRCIRDLKSRGFQGRLLSVPAWDERRVPVARPDHLARRSHADGDKRCRNLHGQRDGQRFPSGHDQSDGRLYRRRDLFDWTFRRMILHYANLCVVAGGVNLFVIGSELRGLEILRGPGWTKPGRVDGSGNAVWDYPMVAQLNGLANDVRTTFDSAGLTKNLDNSGEPHHLFGRLVELDGLAARGANGQWPHLDQLWANPNIDFVSFDNYMPLSDWTTGPGGLGRNELVRAEVRWGLAARTNRTQRAWFERAANDLLDALSQGQH